MKHIIGMIIEHFNKRFKYSCFIWALFWHPIKNDSWTGNKICCRWWCSANSQYFSWDGRVKYLTWHITAHKWKAHNRKWKCISFIVLIISKYSIFNFDVLSLRKRPEMNPNFLSQVLILGRIYIFIASFEFSIIIDWIDVINESIDIGKSTCSCYVWEFQTFHEFFFIMKEK